MEADIRMSSLIASARVSPLPRAPGPILPLSPSIACRCKVKHISLHSPYTFFIYQVPSLEGALKISPYITLIKDNVL